MSKFWLVYILLFSFSGRCLSQGTDRSQFVMTSLHTAINKNEKACYEVKMSIKPITMRDTAVRKSVVQFYPAVNQYSDSCAKNFFFYSHFETWGHLHYEDADMYFDANQKLISHKNWKSNGVLDWVGHMRFYLYAPLFTSHNTFNISEHDIEDLINSKDSLYYRGESYMKDDSITVIQTVRIQYQPPLRVIVKSERIHQDPLMSQVFIYEITESDGDTAIFIPKEISSDYLSLFPGYSWKLPEEKKEARVSAIKAGSKAIPWKALTLTGDTVLCSDIKERFVILDFWYMACGPCWASIKDLSRYNNTRGNDISILAVNAGDWKVKEDAVTIFKRQGGNYQVLFDVDESLVNDYEISGYPNIFVIDQKTNEIIFRKNGHFDDLEEKIDECINRARGN